MARHDWVLCMHGRVYRLMCVLLFHWGMGKALQLYSLHGTAKIAVWNSAGERQRAVDRCAAAAAALYAHMMRCARGWFHDWTACCLHIFASFCRQRLRIHRTWIGFSFGLGNEKMVRSRAQERSENIGFGSYTKSIIFERGKRWTNFGGHDD